MIEVCGFDNCVFGFEVLTDCISNNTFTIRWNTVIIRRLLAQNSHLSIVACSLMEYRMRKHFSLTTAAVGSLSDIIRCLNPMRNQFVVAILGKVASFGPFLDTCIAAWDR
jgi:hypothetical protein